MISLQNGWIIGKLEKSFSWIYATVICELALDFENPGELGSQIFVLHPQVSKRSSVGTT